MDKWQKITKMKTKQKTTAQIKLQKKMRWTAETVPKTALKMLPETVMETKHPMHMTKSRMIILADTKEE